MSPACLASWKTQREALSHPAARRESSVDTLLVARFAGACCPRFLGLPIVSAGHEEVRHHWSPRRGGGDPSGGVLVFPNGGETNTLRTPRLPTHRWRKIGALVRPAFRGSAAKLALVAAGFAGYAFVFTTTHHTAGLGVSSMLTVPVVLTSWFFGLRAGIAVSLLALPFDALIWKALEIDGWDMILTRGGLLGHLVLVCVGTSFGWLRDLSRTTQRQARELGHERELLRAREAESVDLLKRREVLLRLARRLALETDADGVLVGLLEEALAVLSGASASVFRWDEPNDVLITVGNTNAAINITEPVKPGTGAVGRAVARREPVILNDYQHEADVFIEFLLAGVQAAVAVPLLHEGRLLGALGVVTTESGRHFTPEDAELLELLAGLASLTLVGLERARLEGALLAVRTLEHELNNRLALTCGYAELLLQNQELPSALRPLVQDALSGALSASQTLERLRRVTHLQERDWGLPGASTIDLDGSALEANEGDAAA